MVSKEFFKITKIKIMLAIVLIVIPILLFLNVLTGPETKLKEILVVPLLIYPPVLFVGVILPHQCQLDVCGPSPYVMIPALIIYAYLISCLIMFIITKIKQSKSEKSKNKKSVT